MSKCSKCGIEGNDTILIHLTDENKYFCLDCTTNEPVENTKMEVKETSNEFYLMDLERTLLTGIVHYWKPNKHGYSNYLEEAGIYTYKQAKEIVASDLDNTTVMIDKEVVLKVKG